MRLRFGPLAGRAPRGRGGALVGPADGGVGPGTGLCTGLAAGLLAHAPPRGGKRPAQLARSLDLPCVAKGVETREQLQAVRACGVPFAQGYLFTRPQSAASIEQLVLRERPFAAIVKPPPMLLGMLELDRADAPAIKLGAPAVP